jgi:hypothetical protein
LRRAIYTVLIGDYEELNELALGTEPGIDRLCFTDNKNLVSGSWKIVHVDPDFPADPIRSQRMLKIRGHSLLAEYDETLYVDNTVELLVPVSQILDTWLVGADVAIPTHSFRDAVIDEFQEVTSSGLDSRERFTEQLDHYQKEYAAALRQRPFWNGIIARRKSSSSAALGVAWADHVLRYSRRDQLSLTTAIQITGVEVKRIEIDNYSSPIHRWPTITKRKTEVRLSSLPDYFLVAEKMREDLEWTRGELNRTLSSVSWKITKPLRFLRSKFSPR